MALDLKATRAAATSGDPTRKIAVTRKWLLAVCDEIEELRKRPEKKPDDRLADLFRQFRGKS